MLSLNGENITFTFKFYKLGLIKTLIDRAYKINNTTQGFQNDIKNLSVILKRNLFPSWLIDKSVKDYLRKVKTTEQDIDTSTFDASKCHFYKLPYIGFYSSYTGKKISSIINKYCKGLIFNFCFPKTVSFEEQIMSRRNIRAYFNPLYT